MINDVRVGDPRTRRTVPGLPAVVAGGTVLWTAVLCVLFLGSAVLASGTVMGRYNASAYWVSYRDGFVKRGLPGAVLELVLGRPPDLLAVSVVGVLLIVLVGAALELLTVLAARVVPDPRARLLAAALVVVSPFTFSLAVQNRGRYDAVVVLCLVLVAWLAVGRSRLWLRVPGIAAAVLVGSASMEIAFGFLAVVALVAVARLGRGTAERIGLGAVALLPGLVVTGASLVLRPDVGTLAAATERAAAAGLPVTETEESSISALGQTTADALGFTAAVSPASVLVCAALLGGCYALATYLLWVLTGRVRPRWVLAVAVANAVAALVLSAVGTDYRRWWGLAFVAMAGCLVLLARDVTHVPPPRHADERPWRRLVVVGLLVSAALQVFPIWPSWEPTAATDASLVHIRQH